MRLFVSMTLSDGGAPMCVGCVLASAQDAQPRLPLPLDL
jgi:hypothetical protein